MAIGDVTPVSGVEDLHCLDTGMYDVEAYGSVYIYDTPRPAVVDTGIGTNRDLLFDALSSVGIGREDLELVLPTHVHLDHAGGAGYLAAEYPNATVLTHERGAPHLVDPSRLVAGTKAAVGDQWEYYVDPEPVPEDSLEALTDGDAVDLGDRTLDVHHAPGHAPHQVVFHEPDEGVAFTADAAGIYVAARDDVYPTTPPANFDLEQCLADVNAVAALDPEVLCFGHFGPRPYDESLLDGYRRTLVEWVEAVRRKRAELDDDGAVAEYFADHTDKDDLWGDRKARAEERLNVRGVLGYLDRVAAE